MNQASEQDNNEEIQTILKPLYSFTEKLFSALNGCSTSSNERESENIIISPISIHKALNLVLLGTDVKSATERELLDTLGYSGLSDGEVQKCHMGYARLLALFRDLTNKALTRSNPERRVDEDENQHKRRLRYGDFGPSPPVLDMFNMVITKSGGAGVLPAYQEQVEKHYESTVENVDDRQPESKTSLMEKLNSWARGAGYESPIITQQELSAEFVAILVSAIRVQASWFEKFTNSQAAAIFYTHGLRDKPVSGTRLHQDEIKRARYLELTDSERARHKHTNQQPSANSEVFRQFCDLKAQIVQVPLEGDLTYTMFEPLEHSTPGDNKLNRLVKELFASSEGETRFAQALRLLDSSEGHVSTLDLTMPKFKFEKELGLVQILKSMGLELAFDAKRAEISRITGNRLHISEVRHQAVIDVTERGIKAAGVTKVTMRMESISMSQRAPIRVFITKPFVFLIRYKTIPLFLGQLTSL